MNLKIVYEDKHIVIIEKPQKIPSQKDKTNDLDMLTVVCNYFNNKRISIINRLDRPVGGLIIFAKTNFGATYMSRIISSNNVKKEYLAVVTGEINSHGYLEHYLIKNQSLNVSKVVHKNIPNSKIAKLNYKKLDKISTDKYNDLSLVNINLLTGRHHQIRVQFSHIGYPLWGDTKYNKNFKYGYNSVNTALWAYKLSFKNYKDEYIVCSISPENIFPFSLFY